MQVLTLTPFYPTASDDAVGCFTAEPLPALEELGIRSHVIAVQPFYRAAARPNPKVHPATWMRYPSLPGGIGLSSAGALLYSNLIAKVRSIHKHQPIHLIHAHAALPCGHAAALLSRELGVPSVVTVHGLDAYFTRQVRGLAGNLCERVAKFVYRSATRVIGISARVRDHVTREASSPVKTSVIHNGVDVDRFRPVEDRMEEPTILSVGNLIPIKGHDILLRAFANVQKQRPDLRCQIIGEGPERSRLQALARDLNISERVEFLGRTSRDGVADAMQRCSVFALPSRYEGLGCVYMEAMSAAKPVIACRGQGIEEIIQHKDNGWLIEPGDSQSLSSALSVLLDDSQFRKNLGRNARYTVLQGLTLRHQAARLAELYRECVA
jgi:teichuronic acid biosynthesis glycosyltransferase TuaC